MFVGIFSSLMIKWPWKSIVTRFGYFGVILSTKKKFQFPSQKSFIKGKWTKNCGLNFTPLQHRKREVIGYEVNTQQLIYFECDHLEKFSRFNR